MIVLWDRQYNTRFWPNVESWTAMREAGYRGLKAGGQRALFYDVLGGDETIDERARTYMMDAWGSKSAQEAAIELGRDDIFVTNQRDKATNLKVLVELDDRVRRCYEVSAAAPRFSFCSGST